MQIIAFAVAALMTLAICASIQSCNGARDALLRSRATRRRREMPRRFRSGRGSGLTADTDPGAP